MAVAELKRPDFKVDVRPDWCPGCGDFGILNAIRQALANMRLEPHNVAVVSGIGCSGKTPHYIGTYGFHTLHGRALPFATGIKLANRELTVIAVGGDGDGYGIGAGYFVNTGRRNLDFTYIVFNNGVYGLTKGQASPTLVRGEQTKSMSEAAIQDGINPIGLAISSGYTFVARGYAMDPRGLAKLIVDAVRHRGTSFIDVLQPCPVYNDKQTVEWYMGRDREDKQRRVYQLIEEGFDPVVRDPSNVDEIVQKKQIALAKSYEWGDRIPIGVLFQIDMPTFEDGLDLRRPDGSKGAIMKQAAPYQDFSSVLGRFR
ncbi:MAG: thiamine pyrophosphate-dependent enzyme [Chloroflexi bacterium]|nr:thiamine pyrophosphate-dependent enzyme [Chloroflexota bacterium]MCY3938495.1 thiamine pyrophosphate-dependent enzyme [Chloroflexota bacterium]